jgi:hypothetical protein
MMFLRSSTSRVAVVALITAALAVPIVLPSLAYAQLEPQGTLSGTVRDANGQPLPDAGITACLDPASPATGCSEFLAPSDGAGNYTLDLPVGTYNLSASLGSVRGPVVQVVVSDGEPTFQDLTVLFGTLSGTVRDSNGAPIPGPVPLVGACPAPGSPGPGCLILSSVDGAGQYSFVLAPGAYNVAAVLGSLRSPDVAVVVSAGQETVQDLTVQFGTLSGTVVDGNGQPFPSAGLGACPDPGVPSPAPFCPGLQNTFTDGSGNYTLRLGTGTYNIAGFDARGGIPNVIVGALTSITVAAGETIICSVQMPNAPVCGGDNDGVPDEVEDGAPNGGDGNNDGTPDSEQPNVTSLPNAVNSQYVTLESPPGTNLIGVSAALVPGSPAPPAGATFPVGVLDFQVEGVAVGGTTTLTLHLPVGSAPNGYLKLHDGAWLDFSANASIAGDQVALTLTDGAVGDDDAVANGTIVDPGAPTVLPRMPQSKDDCNNGGWKDLVDDRGRPFKNQGDCVSFVATNGKNKAKG